VYDRDFKRDAYLALGVEEVWLVDLDERAVFVSRRDGEREVRQNERVVWQPAGMGEVLEIELSSLFRGMA
jgi:Uma2 family endonuclease